MTSQHRFPSRSYIWRCIAVNSCKFDKGFSEEKESHSIDPKVCMILAWSKVICNNPLWIALVTRIFNLSVRAMTSSIGFDSTTWKRAQGPLLQKPLFRYQENRPQRLKRLRRPP